MKKPEWDQIINNKPNSYFFLIKELYGSWDIIKTLFLRDLKVAYRETILGPIWYIINPLITTGMFSILFEKIFKINGNFKSTFLFILSGIILWNFFTYNLTKISNFFSSYGKIFAKIYFPKATIIIVYTLISLFHFLIQIIMFSIILYILNNAIFPIFKIHLIIITISYVAMTSIGIGLIINSISYKYKDISQILPFFTNLFMFVTPVLYSSEKITEKYLFFYFLNPLAIPFEYFKALIFNLNFQVGTKYILSGLIINIIIIFIGLEMYRRTESTYTDYR